MAFQRYSSDRTFLKYKDFKPGDTIIEGTFLSDGESQKYGSREFEIRTEDGSVKVLSAIHSLAQVMDKYASLGDYVRVIYKKDMELTQGRGKGKLYRIMDVEIDPERFQPIKGAAAEGSVEKEAATSHSTDEDKTPSPVKSPEGVVL